MHSHLYFQGSSVPCLLMMRFCSRYNSKRRHWRRTKLGL
uniref:Uncharacterized protein n=1 Tax=Crocodylus porosus TaxID=8502 RepID=A0A7M4FUE3_CROPO